MKDNPDANQQGGTAHTITRAKYRRGLKISLIIGASPLGPTYMHAYIHLTPQALHVKAQRGRTSETDIAQLPEGVSLSLAMVASAISIHVS